MRKWFFLFVIGIIQINSIFSGLISIPIDNFTAPSSIAMAGTVSILGLSYITNTRHSMESVSSLDAYTFSHLKGLVGENLTEKSYFSRLGPDWKSVTPRGNKAQGIDHLFIKFTDRGPTDLIVADSKFTKGSLSSALSNQTKSGMQMSHTWIAERLNNDILPDYYELIELEKTGSIPTKPVQVDSAIASVRDIGKDAYYYKVVDDPKWYFSGSSDAETTKMAKLATTTDYIKAVADNKISYRRRVVQYKAGDGFLQEIVYDLDFPGKILERKTFTNLTTIGDILRDPKCWKEISDKYGTSLAHSKKFSDEELFELMTIISNPKKIGSSKAVKKLVTIDGLQSLKSTGKSTLLFSLFAAGTSFVAQSQVYGIDYVDYKRVARDAAIGALTGAAVQTLDRAMTSTIKKLGSSTKHVFIKEGSSAILPILGKQFLPLGVDFVLGVGMENTMIEIERRQRYISNEVIAARRMRSLKIEGLSTSLGLGIIVLASPLPPPLGVIIAYSSSIAIGIGLDYMIPMPEELDPKIIHTQIANNPMIIEDWVNAIFKQSTSM